MSLERFACVLVGHAIQGATEYLHERYPDAWRILLCKRCLSGIVLKAPRAKRRVFDVPLGRPRSEKIASITNAVLKDLHEGMTHREAAVKYDVARSVISLIVKRDHEARASAANA